MSDRFGLDLGDPEDRARARVLLVGWNSGRLSRTAGEGATVVVDPWSFDPNSAVPVPTASARLQRRPRRRADLPQVVAGGEPPAEVDRWAVVSLLSDGDAFAAAERTVLEMLCAAVEAEVGEPAGRGRRAGERPLLSPRERECLQWTAGGKTTWEIAAILEISQNTIDGYIASAARKLGAVNRTQAVAEALRRRLID